MPDQTAKPLHPAEEWLMEEWLKHVEIIGVPVQILIPPLAVAIIRFFSPASLEDLKGRPYSTSC